MLGFVISAASILWLYSFFGYSDPPEAFSKSGYINLLSVAIIVLIVIGFLS